MLLLRLLLVVVMMLLLLLLLLLHLLLLLWLRRRRGYLLRRRGYLLHHMRVASLRQAHRCRHLTLLLERKQGAGHLPRGLHRRLGRHARVLP
jgi:hypothetical protein